MYSSPVKTF